MKSFCACYIYILLFLFISPSPSLFGQPNTLKGTLSLTAKSKKKRISRGNSYRNRVKGELISNEFQTKSNHYDEVIISLKPLSFNPNVLPIQDAKVFQKNKTFSPGLIAVTSGTTVQFINQDDFYHNVFSLTPHSRFNIGRRPAGSVNGAKIKKRGIVKVFCDIHPQMKATIISLDTPYFSSVTPKGTYKINDLPDGKYQIEVYFSENKSIYQIIELKNGETLINNLILDGENTAFIEINTTRLLANVSCCEIGVLCNEIAP